MTEVKWSISKKISFFKVPEEDPTFPGGGGGGSNCLFPIETHITCDFPGGGVRTPCPPSGSALGPHTFVEIDHEIISTVILLPSADAFKKGCCPLQAKARITA